MAEDRKMNPAGEKDTNINVACAEFTVDQKELEVKNSKGFTNDELLNELGFSDLRLKAYDNTVKRDYEEGKVERINQEGKIISVTAIDPRKVLGARTGNKEKTER